MLEFSITSRINHDISVNIGNLVEVSQNYYHFGTELYQEAQINWGCIGSQNYERGREFLTDLYVGLQVVQLLNERKDCKVTDENKNSVYAQKITDLIKGM